MKARSFQSKLTRISTVTLRLVSSTRYHTRTCKEYLPGFFAIDSTMPYLADCFLMFIPTGTIPSSLKSYIQGETPLSTWATVISMIVTYLTVVFGMREIMRDRAPLKLTDLFRAHNLFLSVASLVLVLLIGEEVVSNWIKFGSYGILCAEEAYSQVSF